MVWRDFGKKPASTGQRRASSVARRQDRRDFPMAIVGRRDEEMKIASYTETPFTCIRACVHCK